MPCRLFQSHTNAFAAAFREHAQEIHSNIFPVTQQTRNIHLTVFPRYRASTTFSSHCKSQQQMHVHVHCIALQGCSPHHQTAVDAIHLACFEDVTSKGDLIAAAATTVCCMNINPSANRVASSRVRPLAPYRRKIFLRMSLVLLDMCCWHCKSGCCRTALKMVF